MRNCGSDFFFEFFAVFCWLWLANGFEWAHEQDEDSDGKLDFCLLPCDKSFLAFVLQVDSSGLGSARRSRGKWIRLDSFGLA